ncbi:MAG: SWIM zinc finger family protein [Chloroflexi bacterium]|nr:SWIM zinc finger family protein [Chloroflexota bacterium]
MAVTMGEVGTLQRSFQAKAILRRENAVKPLGNGLYLVESQYRPGDFYRVSLTAGTCHCQDFKRRGPAPCKHLLAAQEVEKASRRRRVKITDITPDGRVLAWYYTDEPTAQAQQPAAPTAPTAEQAERQRRIAAGRRAADELYPQ